jgi:hypothetical protein
VSSHKIAYEVWHVLKVVSNEKTNKVKGTKISMLIQQFELFKMKEEGIVSEMISKLLTIVNSLISLGRANTKEELVRKILKSLTSEWRWKATTIEEAKDLSRYMMDELISKFSAYEVQLRVDQEGTLEKSQRKKDIALKLTQVQP